MMDVFRYYGIDWLLFILVLIHLWLLGNKNRLAFTFGILGCACGVVFGIMIESMASVVMNFTFGLLHFRALTKWSSSPKDVKPNTNMIVGAINFNEEDLNEIFGGQSCSRPLDGCSRSAWESVSNWESEGGSIGEEEK